MLQNQIEHFRQKQMKRDELMQPGWANAADYFREGDTKYGMTELGTPIVVQLLTADDAASSGPTTVGEPNETLYRFPTKSQMIQFASQRECRHVLLGSGKPLTSNHVSSLLPDAAAHSSPIEYSKLVESVRSYCWK